jgi:hypothetical protein
MSACSPAEDQSPLGAAADANGSSGGMAGSDTLDIDAMAQLWSPVKMLKERSKLLPTLV